MRLALFITIYLLILSSHSIGQQHRTIEGKVIDIKTNEGLSSANVFTDNHNGTITNEEGEFYLEIDSITKFISISYIGFETVTYPINSVPNNIRLSNTFYELKEVKISPVDTRKLINNFIKHYKKNKNKTKTNTFFYRQTTKTDSTYNEILEAFFIGESIYNVEKIELLSGRYASLKGDSLNPFTTFTNFFHNSQLTPLYIKNPKKNMVIVPLQPSFNTYYNTKIEKIKCDETNRLLYKVFFIPKQKVERIIVSGSLILDPKNFLILNFKGQINNIPLSSPDKEVKFKNNKLSFNVNYTNKYGCSYIESINIKSSFLTILPIKTQKVFINSVLYNTNSNLSIEKSFKLKPKTSLINKIMRDKYNPDFWSNNPIIKRTPLEDEAIDIFEKNNLFGTYKN
ncbi:MAG: carboxypeptidase-like regulatory domain-containing protein [bacterium]